jgi:nifR3 family TIM-barrel protein
VIDINMGCPAPKVAMNGGGSSLLKKPELAYEITKAVVDAVDIPVTVKIRKGWDDDNVNAVHMAELMQKAGAAAIAIHGRTRQQMYSGKVDYDIIKQVKQAVSIPVIGNGDIVDEQSATIMLEKTGCDAIMIGRGALGNPWLFSQINAYLDECRVIPKPTVTQKMVTMLKHIEKIIEYKGEYTAMREARHHAAYYTKGMHGGAALRKEISSFEHFEQLQELALRIVKDNE